MNTAPSEASALSTETRVAPRESLASRVVNYLLGSIVPTVPVIIISGLVLSLLALAESVGLVKHGSGTYNLINSAGGTPLFFLPVIIGYSAAKALGANELMGLLVGAVLLQPSLVELINQPGGLKAFGVTVPAATYNGTILPAVLGVWVMKLIYDTIHKHLPQIAGDLVTPFLTFVLTVPLLLYVIGPAGYYAGVGISNALGALVDLGLGWLVVMLVAMGLPFLMLTGIQSVFIFPMILGGLATNGYDELITPAGLILAFALAGMSLAIMFRAENRTLKSHARMGTITGLFGVSEQPLFTLAYPLKRPLVGVLVGCFFGSIIAGIFEIKAFTFAISGLVALPGFIPPSSMLEGNEGNLMYAALAFLVAFLTSFISTWLIGLGSHPAAMPVHTSKRSVEDV